MRGAALEGMGGGTNGDIIFRNIFFVVVKFFWIIPFDKGKADLAIAEAVWYCHSAGEYWCQGSLSDSRREHRKSHIRRLSL